MTLVRIRDTEACERQPHLLWDTIWVQRLDASGGYGDWVLAGAGDQVESLGGLRAEASLHTATLIQLFTDSRADESDRLPSDDGDRRGWWGDSIRLDGEPEAPIGCKLWLWVERGVLTEDTRRSAQDTVEDAMAVLLDQGAVARTEVVTDIDHGRQALLISISHYDESGDRIYDQRFGVLWSQVTRNARMNFGDELLVA
jgi:phage gp46-like protein